MRAAEAVWPVGRLTIQPLTKAIAPLRVTAPRTFR